MKKEDIQEMLVSAARRCSTRLMQTGNGGNLSMRLSGASMVVKASKCSFETCNSNDFVVSDFYGKKLEGERNPSRESLLHGRIYKRFGRIGAIVHCHAPYATAYAAAMEPLAFSTYHSEVKLKESVKVFDTKSYVVSEQDVDKIMHEYPAESQFAGFLLKGHGLVAVGTDIEDALCVAELIEETAKIHILSKI